MKDLDEVHIDGAPLTPQPVMIVLRRDWILARQIADRVSEYHRWLSEEVEDTEMCKHCVFDGGCDRDFCALIGATYLADFYSKSS